MTVSYYLDAEGLDFPRLLVENAQVIPRIGEKIYVAGGGPGPYIVVDVKHTIKSINEELKDRNIQTKTLDALTTPPIVIAKPKRE